MRRTRIASSVAVSFTPLHSRLVHASPETKVPSYKHLVLVPALDNIVDLRAVLRCRGQTGSMTVCGTPIWTAPEILRGESYNESVRFLLDLLSALSSLLFSHLPSSSLSFHSNQVAPPSPIQCPHTDPPGFASEFHLPGRRLLLRAVRLGAVVFHDAARGARARAGRSRH